jgi:hypothetical protein
MATTSKVLARTAAATTSTTLYTQPNTSTITVVTNINVTNTTTTAATFTISIDSVALQSASTLSANSTAYLDLKQVIPASNPAKTITGSASTTGVNFHISGVEIN